LFRRIRNDDRDAYISMARAFYRTDAVLAPVPDDYIERTFDELMRSDTYISAYILEADGRAAGYALLCRTWSQEAGGMNIWVDELYVREPYRNAGLGSAFLKALSEIEPAARYRLEIEPEHESAVRLYRRLGFEDMPYGQMVRKG